MENIFYFKHSILNTPCPPSPGARLRDLKTIFYNWFFKFISHQAFSHSRDGHDAGSAAAPALGGGSHSQRDSREPHRSCPLPAKMGGSPANCWAAGTRPLAMHGPCSGVRAAAPWGWAPRGAWAG